MCTTPRFAPATSSSRNLKINEFNLVSRAIQSDQSNAAMINHMTFEILMNQADRFLKSKTGHAWNHDDTLQSNLQSI